MFNSGDYLLELRLGPLKGLCCGEGQKQRQTMKAINQVGKSILEFEFNLPHRHHHHHCHQTQRLWLTGSDSDSGSWTY